MDKKYTLQDESSNGNNDQVVGKMNRCIIWCYLLFINLISGFIFAYDKRSARLNQRRIHEKTLHFFEMLGGVFTNMILMYSIHHKNRKFRYYGVTWVVMIGWMIVMIYEFRVQLTASFSVQKRKIYTEKLSLTTS